MVPSFVVYIDESGDEGFQFDRGSSEWFILSAVVNRKDADHQCVTLMREARKQIGKPANYIIHFRNLSHEQRIPFVNLIGGGSSRVISILCHKRWLTETEYLQRGHRLYYYSVRYLLERVSWLCRDYPRKTLPGDGTAEIIFSNRSGMSYEDIKSYMRHLKGQSKIRTDIQIEWSIIKPENIRAVPHRLRAGLQIADAVASGFQHAFERRYEFTEDRYARSMLPVTYKYGGKLNGYGIKIWPREALRQIQQNKSYRWLFG